MIARFRSLDTWTHLAQLDVTAWDVPIFSASNKAGSLTVIGDHPELAMTWASFDGRIYYVENATPGNGSTKLTVKLPYNAFSRDMAFTPMIGSLESYVAGIITSEFVNQTDAAYAMPYLSVTYSGATNVALTFSAGEVMDFLDILRLADERGIAFDFAAGATTLSLNIHPRQTQSRNLVLGDGHSQLVGYTRSYATTTKVTVRRVTVNEDESITVNSSADWYIQPDGSISTTPPTPRLRGKWAVVSVDDDDITDADAAWEALRESGESYKLTFYSDTALGYGDTVTARFGGMLQTGTITACTVSRNDPRYLYEIGNLPTTLTERLSVSGDSAEQSMTLEGSNPNYLSRTGGSVGGNLNVTKALKAGTLILSSASYGTTLPASGVEGQVFFLLS